jgi:hypothetical protein
MTHLIEIEDIDTMRRREGINDVALREEIRELRVGDFVKLTLLSGTMSSETVAVRITSIKGSAFRGKLAGSPTSAGFSTLRAGSALAFTTAHIHSLLKGRTHVSNDIVTFDHRNIRGADSNSLLRMYDVAKSIFNKSVFQQERKRADKAIRRIVKELDKRNVPFRAKYDQGAIENVLQDQP